MRMSVWMKIFEIVRFEINTEMPSTHSQSKSEMVRFGFSIENECLK